MLSTATNQRGEDDGREGLAGGLEDWLGEDEEEDNCDSRGDEGPVDGGGGARYANSFRLFKVHVPDDPQIVESRNGAVEHTYDSKPGQISVERSNEDVIF